MDDYAQGAWQAERQNAINATSALNQANANIDYLNGIVRNQNARIAQLEEQLAIAKADLAGRLAQFDAFEAAHPTSPMLTSSGKVFKSGNAKSKIRLVFERAFDEKLRSLGIADPASRRLD